MKTRDIPDLSKSDVSRFMDKQLPDPNSGCFLWDGTQTINGYGQFLLGSRKTRRAMYLAHRISWKICNGNIPDGLQVLRRCDNAECTNPDHLYLGSHEENFRDVVMRKRASRVGSGSLPFGVVKAHGSARFCSVIRFRGKKLYLGTFSTAKEANEVANRKREELYGPSVPKFW